MQMSLSLKKISTTGTARMWRTLSLAALCVAWTHNAMAVLGQPLPPGTSTTPGSAVRASATGAPVSAKAAATPGTATSASRYTVSKTVQDNGTTISEYATPAGLVFALSWEGPFMPDLNSLLGSYFSAFKAQADASRSTRNIGTPVGVDTGKLVVRSNGRMRNYTGYAYAADLIPGGVTISDVLP
jgi:hypothetical protein